MAESTKKATVKRVFGSLINNGMAIDGAKFSPWWVGLLMFIFGLLLPIVPLFVSSATTDGTSFLDNNACQYGLGMDKTFGIAISELDGALTFDNTEKTISYTASSRYSDADEYLIGGYIATSGDCAGQYELRVYYSDKVSTEEEINQFINSKEGIIYKKGTTTVAGLDEDGYTPSSVYFFKNGFCMDVYNSNTKTKKVNMGFLSDLKRLDYNGGDLKKYFVGESFDKDNKDNRIAAVDKLREFIDITYKTAKLKAMWLGSLIYLGIYAGVNVFMILMIFLMSRGKNNPNRYLTFWTCTKINWWESLCPGLLGLILGFIFTSQAVMLYVLLISMRTMWLTMREMRPQIQ